MSSMYICVETSVLFLKNMATGDPRAEPGPPQPPPHRPPRSPGQPPRGCGGPGPGSWGPWAQGAQGPGPGPWPPCGHVLSQKNADVATQLYIEGICWTFFDNNTDSGELFSKIVNFGDYLSHKIIVVTICQ